MRRVIFFLSLVLFFTISQTAFAASLSVSPASGTYSVGDTITARVVVSSDTSLNAVSGNLSFTSSIFSVDSVSKTGSILNFWVSEPSFSASSVQFEGVSLAGFSGSANRVVTVTLRAKKTGIGTVSFQSGQILANDGSGTDVTGVMSGATYTIVEKPATPPSAPKEEKVPIEAVPGVLEVAPPVLTPSIVLADLADGLVILGTSGFPNAKAVLTFVGTDGSSLIAEGTSDEKGAFKVQVPKILKSGPYAVTAVMVPEGGAKSELSNPLTIQIGETAAINIGWKTLTYTLGGLALVLVLVALYLFWFGFMRVKNITKKFDKELIEAQEALKKSFSLLKQDVNDHLKKIKTREDGATEDKEALLGLKEDLQEAEDFIKKEIKDIGSEKL